MRKLFWLAVMLLLSATESLAAGQWEKQGQDYYLGKNNRDNFSAISAGANKFSSKYKNYDGVDFWVRGEGNRRDYGRLDLQGNNLFSIPIRSGMKIDELHFLAGGNVGNSYEQDDLLRLYGDNYYYAVISVIFVYQDGGYKSLAVPVFWDWFHLGSGLWSRDGASIKSLGNNPVRKDCTMFHLKFVNPRPAEPIKDILVTDSWLADRPFSEIFALTLKSSDMMEAAPREDRSFPVTPSNAAGQPPDSRTRWQFDKDLDGWSPGNSPNWDAEAFWQAESYAKTGVVIIPGCNWAGDKTSWIEKKVALPDRQALKLEFSRHSAAYSQLDKLWTDGALKVIVKSPLGQEVVYEKMYSGQWSTESVDLSKYKGKTVILRFENHGGGSVRLGQSTSSLCDGEDAIIDDIRLKAD